MMEPVAWTWTDQTGAMWLTADRDDVYQSAALVGAVPEALVRQSALSDAEARIAELERELSASKERESEAWSRCNRAETKVRGWEDIVVVRNLPTRLVQGRGWGPGGDDDVAIPAITPEKLADILDRATAAEALLKEAGKALEPFAAPAGVYFHNEDTDPVLAVLDAGKSIRVTVGHLRAARAIHHKIGVKDE